MKADEVTGKLAALFPKAFADPDKAQERLALYREHLTSVEGQRLATAYKRTMAEWRGWDPPMPAHILDNLPPLDAARQPDGDTRMDDREVDALMAQLVASSLGREIVEAGLAHQLENLVTQRKVRGIGQLSRHLIGQLQAAQAAFESGFGKIDEGGPFAGSLKSLGAKLRARAERCNAKWREFLQSTEGAA